jgi:hypothetical protein
MMIFMWLAGACGTTHYPQWRYVILSRRDEIKKTHKYKKKKKRNKLSSNGNSHVAFFCCDINEYPRKKSKKA